MNVRDGGFFVHKEILFQIRDKNIFSFIINKYFHMKGIEGVIL